MTSAWPYPGAKWYKFDFHTHTPKSTDSMWAKYEHNLSPQDWLLKYMAEGIDCVAVTDHNGAGWVDALQSTYEEMKINLPEGFRDITVFPGVELTTEDEFHLIVVFAPGTSQKKIEQFITSAGYRGDCGDHSGSGSMSLLRVLNEVITLPEFDCIPIAAHADRDNGLLQTKNESQSPVANDRYLRKIFETGLLSAIEVVDTEVDKPQSYIQSRLNLSEVVGSDSHGFRGNDKPGSRYTWVKMETPTLASLKLALIDGQEFSIKRFDDLIQFNPYETPDNFIESIQVKDARYMGQGRLPSSLSFSPYSNAIVGGRGTGKSTITHSLRAVSGKQSELDEDTTPYQTYSKFMQVPKSKDDFGALKEGTEVELIYMRLGKRYRLIWSQVTNETTVFEEDGGDWKTSQDQEITKDRFPIDLYSQGQIATLVGENKQPLLELIDRSANIDHEELQTAQLKFCAKRAEARSLKQVADQIPALKRQLQDIRAKIQKLSQSNHQKILTEYNKFQKQKQLFETKKSETWDLINRLSGFFLHEEIVSTIATPSDFDADIQAFTNSLDTAVGKTKNAIKDSIEGLQTSVNDIEAVLISSNWKAKFDQAVKQYTDLQLQLQNEGINNLKEYGQLVQSEKELADKLVRAMNAQQQLQEKVKLANEDLKEIRQQRLKQTERRKLFLQEVLSDNHYVKISVRPYGCSAMVMEHAFRDLLSAKTEFASDIYIKGENGKQGVVSSFLNAAKLPNQEDRDRAIFDIQSLLYKVSTGADKQTFSARFRNKLVNMNTQHQDFADSLLYWFPEDGLDVEYSRTGDGKNFTPITQGSAGQRAAAMLAFLLAHSEKPLFIDQPEDDLDNSLIYDLIVSQIKATKSKRQIIMVTHNPNIVVNGDAEMVHALDFNNQCFIKNKGSIQDSEMRETICRIMEGGTTAFNNRYKRLI
ncbi:TrlF family AAA-like ATPase [Vibrio alginolyticus]|nr:AAA family ATPase [Vibrio alginolyticus]ELA7188234.1 AAA family ATPase [Vibrio alginolyticus]